MTYSTFGFLFYFDSDPDHEPISDVLTRLGDYTQTFNPGISFANTECECQSQDQRVPSRLAKLYDSDQEDSSDSDDEGTCICIFPIGQI